MYVLPPCAVLDSTGKIPDGVLSDVSYLCDVFDFWVKTGFCDNLREEIRDLVNIVIPRGNTVAVGSFEGGGKKVALIIFSTYRLGNSLLTTLA